MSLITKDDFKAPPAELTKRYAFTMPRVHGEMLKQLATDVGTTATSYLKTLIRIEDAEALVRADDVKLAAEQTEAAAAIGACARWIYQMPLDVDATLKRLAYKFDARKSVIVAALIAIAVEEAANGIAQ